jgi:hypothetical protein
MRCADYEAERRTKIEAMPRVRFVCGRGWEYGPGCFNIGIYWDKNPDPADGEVLYRRQFLLCWYYRIWIRR